MQLRRRYHDHEDNGHDAVDERGVAALIDPVPCRDVPRWPERSSGSAPLRTCEA
jgi:hypothetical protein